MIRPAPPLSSSRGRWCRIALALVACAASLAQAPAQAWSSHALGTWPALAALPQMQALPPVKVESLESFLAAEGKALQALLDAEEQWARANVPTYPPRPDALRLRADDNPSPAELRRRFIAAVRIHAGAKLTLALQTRPGEGPGGRAPVRYADVTTLPRDGVVKATGFVALREGESVPALDVVASASDEPDFGLDVGLWEDNGTEWGRVYGFGRQPFGNPALDFSSQAPFHMGFFHEDAIVYKAAAFLQRTYPEYRIHLWQALARHALATGHGYWGWRFAGWALHYVQDLTQPYHARVLPGVGTARMLWINALDIAGWSTPKNHAITRVSNRHLALENFQRTGVLAGYRRQPGGETLLQAFADTAADASHELFAADAPRAVVSKQSSSLHEVTDRAIVESLPARYVDDPSFEFGNAGDDLDLHALLSQSAPAARETLTQALRPLLVNFGAHTRAFVRSLLAPR